MTVAHRQHSARYMITAHGIRHVVALADVGHFVMSNGDGPFELLGFDLDGALLVADRANEITRLSAPDNVKLVDRPADWPIRYADRDQYPSVLPWVVDDARTATESVADRALVRLRVTGPIRIQAGDGADLQTGSPGSRLVVGITASATYGLVLNIVDERQDDDHG